MFTEGEGVRERQRLFFFHTVQATFPVLKNQYDKILCAPMKSGMTEWGHRNITFLRV